MYITLIILIIVLIILSIVSFIFNVYNHIKLDDILETSKDFVKVIDSLNMLRKRININYNHIFNIDKFTKEIKTNTNDIIFGINKFMNTSNINSKLDFETKYFKCIKSTKGANYNTFHKDKIYIACNSIINNAWDINNPNTKFYFVEVNISDYLQQQSIEVPINKFNSKIKYFKCICNLVDGFPTLYKIYPSKDNYIFDNLLIDKVKSCFQEVTELDYINQQIKLEHNFSNSENNDNTLITNIYFTTIRNSNEYIFSNTKYNLRFKARTINEALFRLIEKELNNLDTIPKPFKVLIQSTKFQSDANFKS